MKNHELSAWIRSEKSLDLKKLSYQISPQAMKDLVTVLNDFFLQPLSIIDDSGKSMTIRRDLVTGNALPARYLAQAQSDRFSVAAMTEEIEGTLGIENMDTSRESVRKILSGKAPADQEEARLEGMKRGLDFIAEEKITRRNIRTLYQLMITDWLIKSDRPSEKTGYRAEGVYVVGKDAEVIHAGIDAKKLPESIDQLVLFLQQEHELDPLNKAVIAHYYIAYLHPWFDGNGRMARMLHIWFLQQEGYSSALYYPLSKYILHSRNKYYRAFRTIETNRKYLGVLDLTPMLQYFSKEVYAKIALESNALEGRFFAARERGEITEKEQSLWQFIQTVYGEGEFSTKELEKSYGDAAYATIYKFVHKFVDLELLAVQVYGNRKKYYIRKTGKA